MATEFDPSELQSLAAKLSSGDMTSEEHSLLEQVLRNSPAARSHWFLVCDVENGLRDWAEVAVQQNELSVIEPQSSQPQPQGDATRIRMRGNISVAITLLAAVSITLIVWWLRPTGSTTANSDPPLETLVSEVATLADSINAEWEGDSGPAIGSTLVPSTLHLRSGALLIEFFSGTSVVLEGPATFELVSTNAARLKLGRLNARVPPQAQGFSIQTPTGEVIDHGTDFGLVLDESQGSELHVFEGRVELKSDEISRSVHSGEAVSLDVQETEVFGADRTAFLEEQELILQSQEESRRRLETWRQASLDLSRDPATRCHLRFAADTSEASERQRTVYDSPARKGAVVNGRVVGSEWVMGRWAGKRAIQFQRPGDRIRLTIPEPLPQVTLLAWVKVQSLPRWQNVIIAAESETEGSLHWHLTKRGQLRLEIARDLGRPYSDWEAVESTPFLGEDRQQRWLLLATTFDGTTIRHYADGQLVGQGASFTPQQLHLGTFEIGNWSGETRRSLHGAIDEVAILDRVLSATEISEIYEYGQP